MTTVDGIRDASCKIHVVILEQDHVEETDTMVHTTTYLHGLLFEHTHARGGLAGVEYAGVGTLQALHILVGHRGDTTHTLHDVQHEALRLQQ